MKQLWAPWRLEYVAGADEEEGCIFCRAVAAPDADGLVVQRGELAFCLLNKYPYASGHLMAAPYRHVAEFAELETDEVLELHRLAAAGMGALTDVRAAGLQRRLEPRPHRRRRRGRPRPPPRRPALGGRYELMPVLADVKVLPQHLDETRARCRGLAAGLAREPAQAAQQLTAERRDDLLCRVVGVAVRREAAHLDAVHETARPLLHEALDVRDGRFRVRVLLVDVHGRAVVGYEPLVVERARLRARARHHLVHQLLERVELSVLTAHCTTHETCPSMPPIALSSRRRFGATLPDEPCEHLALARELPDDAGVVDAPPEQLEADAEVSRAVFEVAVLKHPLEGALSRHEHRRAEPVGFGLLRAVPVPTPTDADRRRGLVLEDHVRKLVCQAARIAAGWLPRVVDDQALRAEHHCRRREAGVLAQQSPDAAVRRPVLS